MVSAMAPWIHVNKSEGFGNDLIEVTRDEKFEQEPLTISSAGGVVREVTIEQSCSSNHL